VGAPSLRQHHRPFIQLIRFGCNEFVFDPYFANLNTHIEKRKRFREAAKKIEGLRTKK